MIISQLTLGKYSLFRLYPTSGQPQLYLKLKYHLANVIHGSSLKFEQHFFPIQI